MNHPSEQQEPGETREPRWLKATLLGLILAATVAISVPELLHDRIHPYDGALYAANGAMFQTLLKELPSFIRAPKDWLYTYYDQYPALAVRRHPPLFGAVEALMYFITGPSTRGAYLTLLLFSLAFSAGVYCMCLQFWRSHAVAFATSAIVLSTSQVIGLMRSVWLDIPSLALAVWGIVLFGKWIEGGGRSVKWGLATAAAVAMSLYTYQLPALMLAGMVPFTLLTRHRKVLMTRAFLISAAAFVLVVAPLVVFTAKMAKDNLEVAAGVVREEWKVFTAVEDKGSLEYWTYNITLLLHHYPVQSAGIGLWLISLWRRRPTAGELLMVCCFLTAFAAFTWMPSKGERYALYFALPASPLGAVAINSWLGRRSSISTAARDGWLIGLGTLAAAIQAAVLFVPTGYYVSSMDPIARDVLKDRPNARIFYCGGMDGAFVFYLRAADDARQARIYRATVQAENPAELPKFIADSKIDTIVVEANGAAPSTPSHLEFRRQIENLVRDGSTFRGHRQFDLQLGSPGNEKPANLVVYERIEQSSK